MWKPGIEWKQSANRSKPWESRGDPPPSTLLSCHCFQYFFTIRTNLKHSIKKGADKVSTQNRRDDEKENLPPPKKKKKSFLIDPHYRWKEADKQCSGLHSESYQQYEQTKMPSYFQLKKPKETQYSPCG